MAAVASGPPEDVRPRDAPLPVGRAPHGARLQLQLGDVVSHPPPSRRTAFCARWATTRSACRPRTLRSRRAGIPGRSPSGTSTQIRRQMQRMGWAIDWTAGSRRTSPRTTAGRSGSSSASSSAALAYRREAPVKWCPNDQTVLANEQVIDGRCERCGAEVSRADLEQWFFRTTDYADQLLDEMSLLEDWPERVLTMQRNWIGRSEGAEVDLPGRRDGVRIAGLHHAPGHVVRRDLLRSRARAPAGRRPRAGHRARREVLDYVAHAAKTAVERAAPKPRRRVSSPAGTSRTR